MLATHKADVRTVHIFAYRLSKEARSQLFMDEYVIKTRLSVLAF